MEEISPTPVTRIKDEPLDLNAASLFCRGCHKPLLMYSLDDDIEGDDMYIVPLNDGQGGEAAYCPPCWEKTLVQ